MKKLLYSLVICLLLITTAESQWSRAGFPGKWIGALFVEGEGIFAAFRDSIYYSHNNGLSWDTLAGIGTVEIFAFCSVNDTLFAISAWMCAGFCPPAPCIFRSSDYGVTWDPVFSAYFGATSIQASNGYIFANPSSQLYQSPDNGSGWNRVPSDTVISGGVLTLVAEGGILYATGNEEGIYCTVDDGTTWTSISSGLPRNEAYSLDVKDSVLFAGTGGNGVYRSLDNGLNWTSINVGLPSNAIVGNLKLCDKGLFAAIGDKIYLAVNSGANWIEVSEGLNLEGYSYVTTLGANSDFLFAGTNDGIWRRPLIEMLSTENLSEGYLPKAYSLEQNYPNPFNPISTIRYDLPKGSEVSLVVYDILGREVARLVGGYMEPGYHQVQWDGRDRHGLEIPSGIYIARLLIPPAAGVTPEYTKAIKMLLLKYEKIG